MRSEQEMMQLILEVAQRDERIRAVYMNGSRTNKNVKKDIFQDYDIGYVVTENKPFIEDASWIDVFGERLYMQCPDILDTWMGEERNFEEGFGWLIQFKDGNRLDLHVVPVEEADITEDKLCVVLLDKDGILPQIPEATDEDYRVKRPTEKEFWAACNEFWWCLNNVAKGLWREEVPYVQDMLNHVIRNQLIKLLNWKIGFETDFQVSTGKSAKEMYRWLPADIWERFLRTYSGGKVAEIWDAVFVMCDLFEETAHEVAGKYGFLYQQEEATNSYAYLKHVRELPKEATAVY
ncbi:MAG: aminoglycoside 6-adenylyltransferase [Lachnospiraceae bacterium]|nr:aminoglycoside 6-adenylyltransferase [Lachnospiraceae bacterium]